MNALKYWIAVASAEHVRKGRADGFMQVCHGKATPLRRIRPGDLVAYYSPVAIFRGKERLQAFTAIGRVRAGDSYSFDMGGGFVPHRRGVDWFAAHEAAIHPLLDRLDFSRGQRNWGYKFRFGLFEISAHDFDVIAQAMDAQVAHAPPFGSNEPALLLMP